MGPALAGSLSEWTVLPTLLLMTVGSVALALVLSRLTLAINARSQDVSTAIVVQFCGTFGVWILAEQLHLSGIITTLVYAMAASRRAAEIVPARIRIPAWAVWEVAVFVLNVLAFILVGFQLRSIAGRMTRAEGARYAVVAAVVCVAVILAPIAWGPGGSAGGLGVGRASVSWNGQIRRRSRLVQPSFDLAERCLLISRQVDGWRCRHSLEQRQKS